MKKPWMAAALAACLGLTLCVCSRKPAAPDPTSALQAIPSADAAQYGHVQDMKNWRNPYIIIYPDGPALLDAADNAEIHLKPDELLPALARLPAAAWPYGRVVAAQEAIHPALGDDAVAIRRNTGIVGGILQGAKIAVQWVPPA